MKLFRLCILTTTLLTLMACSEPEKQVKEEPIRPVKLFNIGHDSQTNVRSFPAEVVANQGSYLAFRVNGELVEFPVLAGEEVKKVSSSKARPKKTFNYNTMIEKPAMSLLSRNLVVLSNYLKKNRKSI
ncbi:hypothetical protein ACOBV9_20870 (plasmid) [Pseudoalteromonas espejiana]